MLANPILWPDGSRCAVAMTWDMDADSAFNWYNRDTADNLVAAQSWTRYDPLIAIPRLVEQFRRRELRSNQISKEDELYWFERGLVAYRKHIGKPPRGWRAPSFAFSKHSLRYLLDAGIQYDSSLMGDDIPYMLSDGSRSLIELPTDWTLDDFPHYAHNRDLGYRMPIAAQQRAHEVFRSEFDAAWEFGALWISVWHPALSRRLARFKAALELLDYMRAKGGVWFARLDEICDHVQHLIAERHWAPRTETLPIYGSPLPEFVKHK